MATITIKNLVKKYGDNTVVSNLNLSVNDGEFITLLGPSGCGKTTTLRAIAGLVEIDDGEIYLDDRLINDLPPHKRSTAMVFQSYALFPHMSVRDNVAFGLRMQKVPKSERDDRVQEVLQMMGLEELADRGPGQLSGGQQQRVAVARAIVTHPVVLLFDEPLSNLDLKLRERLRIDIRELQRSREIAAMLDRRVSLVSEDRKRDVGDRRRNELAVMQQLIERFVSSLDEILFASRDQREKCILRNVEMFECVGERDGDWVIGSARVAVFQFGLPFVEVRGSQLAVRLRSGRIARFFSCEPRTARREPRP